jgi:GNAT superfamily N-acetyltransferase
MAIRSYSSGDLEVCRALWTELVQRHRDIYDDQTIGGEEPGLEFDAHLELVGPDKIWLAESEGRVVGFTSLITKDKEAEIEPVVVSREHRGRKIGEELVKHAIEEAKKLNVLYLNVRPVARNREGISFFRDCGFRTVGHIQLFIPLGEGKEGVWKEGLEIFGEKFSY